MSTIYCVYLTSYSGNRLPPFYIGSSTVKNVESGYHGSVLSKKYKETWVRELKQNPHLFKTKIISLHETSEEARAKELKLQKALNVVHSPLYINQAYAKINGFFGVIVTGKDNPNYGRTLSEETRKKMSDATSGENNPSYGKTGENNPCSISFYAIDPEGKKYIATGITEFARLNNLHAGCIVAILKGKRITHKKWTFSYTEESNLLTVVKREPKEPKNDKEKNRTNFNPTIYKLFNRETKETFEGLRSNFIRKYELSNDGVSKLIHGRRKCHRNWILLEKIS